MVTHCTMELPDNLDTWSNERILEEINTMVSPGFVFSYGPGTTEASPWWYGELRVEGSEDDSAPVWRVEDLNPHGVLLQAFEMLWTPPAAAGIWNPNATRAGKVAVGQFVKSAPDPEDLDPSEIALVYGAKKT